MKSQLAILIRRRNLASRLRVSGKIQLGFWLATWLMGAWVIQVVLDALGFTSFGASPQKGFEVATLGLIFILQLWSVVTGGGLVEDDIKSHRLDWLIAKPIRFRTIIWASYLAEIIWLSVATIGIGCTTYVLARLAGFAGMDPIRTVVVLIIAWLGLSFWMILSSTISLVFHSSRAGIVITLLLFFGSLSLQNPPQSMLWVMTFPTQLFSRLEPFMIAQVTPETLVPTTLATILTILVLSIISAAVLRRRFIW